LDRGYGSGKCQADEPKFKMALILEAVRMVVQDKMMAKVVGIRIENVGMRIQFNWESGFSLVL
jgi:hypothetical protein